MPLSTRVLSACTIIFDKEGQVLIGNKIKFGAYEFPGGKADDDETIMTTAIRELSEETGIRVPHLQYLGYYDRNPKWVCHIFTGLYTCKEQPRVMESDKHSDWRWVPRPMIEKLTEVTRDVIEIGFYEAAKEAAFRPFAYEGLISRN